MIITVLCPNCKNSQKCAPKGEVLSNKSKRCVYCGRSFRINSNINKSQVLKVMK